MSDDSTLFGGIGDGDSDDDDAPPPMFSNKTVKPIKTNKPIEQDQSQIQNIKEKSKTDMNTSNRADQQSIDPFDLKNFRKSKEENELFGFEIAKLNSFTPSVDKIYNPELEIAKLKEEVRIKSEEIQRLNMKMTSTNSNDMNALQLLQESAQNTSSYHLAFLFSSPLVRKINTNIEMIMQLDYQNEIRSIEKQLKNVKHEILYKIDVATISNFRSVVADAPFAIHFTGHGIKNDKSALGPVYTQYKDKGDILLLEDENGMADYLFEKDLTKLVQISKANKQYSHHYEVVFVSSWYSEFAGKIFLSSGVRHVICIRHNERISDKASLRFSRVFYETLFVKKYSVCKAFEIAKEDIRTLINSGEANKFILMVNNESSK